MLNTHFFCLEGSNCWLDMQEGPLENLAGFMAFVKGAQSGIVCHIFDQIEINEIKTQKYIQYAYILYTSLIVKVDEKDEPKERNPKDPESHRSYIQ